jgi:hypothetical protein
VNQGKTGLKIAFFSVFTKRENIETIGESLNRQLRVPRQNAFGELIWKA